MDEHVLLLEDRVFRWEGPKRKQTVIKAKLGRLALTDQRLLFLSSGSNDLSASSLIAGGTSHGASVLRVSSTDNLDIGALQNPGSLEVPLTEVVRAELKGMFKYLVVHYRDAAGVEQASTFSPKNGGMPGGATWVEEIDRRRGG